MDGLSDNMNLIYTLDLNTLQQYLKACNIDIIPQHVEIMKYVLIGSVCQVLWIMYKGIENDYDADPEKIIRNIVTVIDSDFKQSELKGKLKDTIYISCEELIRNYKLKKLLE